MNLYVINLRYLNSYQGFNFRIEGKGYKKIDGEFEIVRSKASDIDDSFIIFFENYFTPYIRRVTYNDIVFSDESELELYKVGDEDVSILAHKILWFTPDESKYLHIIIPNEGSLSVKYLKLDEGLRELERLGLKNLY